MVSQRVVASHHSFSSVCGSIIDYRDVYSAFSQQHAHAHSSELRQHQHQQDQDHPQEEDQIQQPADIESVDWSDPDILFFRNGNQLAGSERNDMFPFISCDLF